MKFSYTLSDVKSVLSHYNLRLTRKFGQNFLIDSNLCQYIVEQGNLTGKEFVLEIGTGLGQLTHLLVQKAKQVVTYEVDAGLYRAGTELLAECENLTRYHQSIIKQNQFPPSLFQAFEQWGTPVLISNFPYSVSTIILLEWGRQRLPFHRIVGTVQKELGEKLMAQPESSHYGIPSVLAQYYFEIEWLKVLPPQVFWPKPEISSVLLRLRPKPAVPEIENNVEAFHHVVKGSFFLRRKTLLNSLANYFKLPTSQVKTLIEPTGLNPAQRGETVRLAEFISLTKSFCQNLSESEWSSLTKRKLPTNEKLA